MLDAVIAFHERQVKIAEGVLAAEGNLYSADARSRAQIEVATHNAFLETLRAAQRDLVDAHPQWRHLKRGSIYSEVGVVTIQAEQPVVDDTVLVLYRGVDGAWFARPPAEFRDGRFAPVVGGENVVTLQPTDGDS